MSNTVPSDQIADLKANAESVDQFVNSNDTATTTRTGKQVRTLAGINTELTAAITDTGWFVVGTFAAGFTYTAGNQVGTDANGNQWSYNGSLPFTVTAGTVPNSPDYTNRGDAALRSGLAENGSEVLISGKTAQSIAEHFGVPYTESLANSKIGIVAGTIRQRASDRTKWDWILDANHTPVGVNTAVPATASGTNITIPFDTTYNRVISFIAGPDETFAGKLGMSVGASVGLGAVVLQATAAFSGAFNLRFDGTNWVLNNGTGQNIEPVAVSYNNGTLRIEHTYCRGIAANVSVWNNGGSILNPYLPIVKAVGNDFLELQWIDTTTGSAVTGAASNRMYARVNKTNNANLFLDGTNNSGRVNGIDMATGGGNFWFFGIFEK